MPIWFASTLVRFGVPVRRWLRHSGCFNPGLFGYFPGGVVGVVVLIGMVAVLVCGYGDDCLSRPASVCCHFIGLFVC